MQIPGRGDFAEVTRRRGATTCCFSVNLLLATVFLSNRLQETEASHQTISINRQQKFSLPFEPYYNLTEDEKRSVVTFEYDIQHLDSSNGSNILASIYLKTRQVIVSQLNRETLNTAGATEVTTTTTTKDFDKTSPLASTTTTTTTTTPPKIITLIITLGGRRSRRGREEVTYKVNDIYFVEYDPEIVDFNLRISIFIRRKDVSDRIEKFHEIVMSPEFNSTLQTEVQLQRAQLIRIYLGMPLSVSTRNNSSDRPSSNICSFWIYFFLYIIHAFTLCSVDILGIR